MIKLMDLPGHSSLSREMMMLGFGVSEGTFSDATLSFLKKMPPPVPFLGLLCGRRDYPKATGSFPGLLPAALQDHPPRAYTQLLSKKSISLQKKTVETGGVFLFLF